MYTGAPALSNNPKSVAYETHECHHDAVLLHYYFTHRYKPPPKISAYYGKRNHKIYSWRNTIWSRTCGLDTDFLTRVMTQKHKHKCKRPFMFTTHLYMIKNELCMVQKLWHNDFCQGQITQNQNRTVFTIHHFKDYQNCLP